LPPAVVRAIGSSNTLVGPLAQALASPPLGDPVDSLLGSAPLIEEPVTSGGDSTLWTDGKPDEDKDEEKPK
jgi:hypothetical protein